MKIIVDTKDFEEFEKTLKSMRKYDFPLAVRGTLNDLAFDVKQRTMPQFWGKQFYVRRKTFLKSHTGVDRCENTFDIGRMSSRVGVYNKGKEIVADRVAMQEEGGTIKDRSIPTSETRIGRSMLKKQKTAMFFRRFKKQSSGRVIMSTAENGAIIKTKKGNIVWHSRDARFKDGKITQGESKLLYLHKNNVNEGNHPFMLPSSQKSSRTRTREFFKENALKRISKYKKR